MTPDEAPTAMSNDVKQILIQGFDRLTNRVDELGKGLASVETMTLEVSKTRHDLRNEMNGGFTKLELRFGYLENERLSPIETELAELRGALRVLTWLASGGGLFGVIGGVLGVVTFFNGGG